MLCTFKGQPFLNLLIFFFLDLLVLLHYHCTKFFLKIKNWNLGMVMCIRYVS